MGSWTPLLPEVPMLELHVRLSAKPGTNDNKPVDKIESPEYLSS
jgi:hypothetical protein